MSNNQTTTGGITVAGAVMTLVDPVANEGPLLGASIIGIAGGKYLKVTGLSTIGWESVDSTP